MLTNSKALFKLLRSEHEWIEFKGNLIHVIPENIFTPDEIEELRNIQDWDLKLGNEYFIANFLPDGERPDWIKKL